MPGTEDGAVVAGGKDKRRKKNATKRMEQIIRIHTEPSNPQQQQAGPPPGQQEETAGHQLRSDWSQYMRAAPY